MMRLNKFLSAAGVCSRRAADEIIKTGRVTVNGRTVSELGCVVNEKKDQILLDGRVLKLPQEFVYLKLNKPKGYACTACDEKGRKTIFDLPDCKLFCEGEAGTDEKMGTSVSGTKSNSKANAGTRVCAKNGAENRAKDDVKVQIKVLGADAGKKVSESSKDGTVSKTRLVNVGRLDYNTEGLIFLTNDGDFANLVMHPRFHYEKEYQVTIEGTILESECAVLRAGVVENGVRMPKAKVKFLSTDGTRTKLSVVISEGQNHQVRRMFDAIGKNIVLLKRVRIGNVTLGGLGRGKIKPMSAQEVAFFKNGQN